MSRKKERKKIGNKKRNSDRLNVALGKNWDLRGKNTEYETIKKDKGGHITREERRGDKKREEEEEEES